MSDLTTLHPEGHAKAAKGHKAKTTKATPAKTVLRAAQLRILGALAGAGAPLTRKQIADAAECDQAGLTEHIGSPDPERRKANDAKHWPSLLTLGMVKATDSDGTTVYTVTAKGQKAAPKLGRRDPQIAFRTRA